MDTIVLGYDAQAIPGSPNQRKPRAAALRRFFRQRATPFDQKSQTGALTRLKSEHLAQKPQAKASKSKFTSKFLKPNINYREVFVLLDSLAQTLAQLRIQAKLNNYSEDSEAKILAQHIDPIAQQYLDLTANILLWESQNWTKDFDFPLEIEDSDSKFLIQGRKQHDGTYRVDWNLAASNKANQDQRLFTTIRKVDKSFNHSLPKLSEENLLLIELLNELLKFRAIAESRDYSGVAKIQSFWGIMKECNGLIERAISDGVLSLANHHEFEHNYFGNQILIKKLSDESLEIKVRVANEDIVFRFKFNSDEEPVSLSFKHNKGQGLKIQFVKRGIGLIPKITKLEALEQTESRYPIIPR